MTKQETIDRLKGKHSLSMKDLRKFVTSNPQIQDDTPVMIERVEDMYFDGIEFPSWKKAEGWSVYKHEGFHYKNALKYNKDISNYKDVLLRGDSDEIENLPYTAEWIEQVGTWSDEYLDSMKEQFYSGHCIADNDGLVLIYSHY